MMWSKCMWVCKARRGTRWFSLPTHVLKRSAFFKDKINSLGEEFEVNNGGLYLVYHKGADEYVRIKKVIDTLATASKDPF